MREERVRKMRREEKSGKIGKRKEGEEIKRGGDREVEAGGEKREGRSKG